jgi:hypothetical protein
MGAMLDESNVFGPDLLWYERAGLRELPLAELFPE